MLAIDIESASKGEVEASLKFSNISSTLDSIDSGGNEVVQYISIDPTFVLE